ncbi:hypothetical protein LGV68_01320 [Vibrio sp. LQ2]|uniref:HNH endonuclease n=1 Tax=Vibrio sp. LQ2 TaxID=2883075 RepID=UPI00208FF2D3|nr:HNH endonuclease [Vibrio sp. LQ2]USP05976.1 hypothetical protein LGV68_01320 [Vibrio sp. LQ2]
MADKFFNDIKKAMLSSNPWSSHYASGFKKYIKEKVNIKQGNYCCYCLRDLLRETERNKHIEHILPKSEFPVYTFDLTNLAISCVRCNSDRKHSDISFLTRDISKFRSQWSNSVYNKNLYRFVHPNLDNILSHLKRTVFTNDNRIYYRYEIRTGKGEFHYNYFDLKFYELQSISENQGIKTDLESKKSRELIELLFKKYL